MDKVVTQLADVLIAGKTPFTFDCKIRFRDDGKEEQVTMCHCTQEEYDKIAGDFLLDEMIFFYLIDDEHILRDTINNEDWELLEVYEDSIILLDADEEY